MTDFTASAAVPNHLLAVLPPDTLAQFRPRLHAVALPVYRILTRPGEPIEAVYFPQSGFVSMVAELKDGGQAEVGLIGREGMVGAPLAAGVNSCFVTTYPQVAGTALSIEAKAFERELEIHPALRALVLRYNEALHAQSMQSAACNGRHTLPQRLARWLLMAHDRVGGDALPLTQEFLSLMLCVRRSSVSETAGPLQDAGAIRYSRGNITMVNRELLEGIACECYSAVQNRFAQLLGAS
jgi:CRP-like cAMP-binding protein